MAGKILFDGKEKKILATDDPSKIVIYFKDVATAFGGIKRAVLKDKGKYCNRISSVVFEALRAANIPTHFIETISDREQLCRKVEQIPLQVIVRNRLAGTTAELLGVDNGTKIPNTVFEIRYNDDELGDPMINRHHVVALGILTYAEVEYMMNLAARANDVMKELFLKAGIELIDFKMEFGRTGDGEIIISDEISPDNARMWDIETGNSLDKDRFRHDLSDVCASYREVMNRLSKI